MIPNLVLASTSLYRKQLLDRLGLSYQTATPKISEQMFSGESPQNLVKRLAEAKARSVAADFPQALIIGSDQVAVLHPKTDKNLKTKEPFEIDHHSRILGKPGSHQKAVAQLRQASGQQVDFYTGVSLYNTKTRQIHGAVVPYCVKFRSLSDDLIERYLQRDKPYDCAGSFKSEGLGIALFESMAGEDPTALVGLPLIALRRLLQREQIEII